MPRGTARASRPADPSARRELVAYGLLALGGLALLAPALVLAICIALPPESTPAHPAQGLAPLIITAVSAIPAGLVAGVLAFIARGLGAGGICFLVVIGGLLEVAAPFIMFAIVTS